MRVVIVHERYAPDIGGGGEIVVQHTAEGLARLGVKVTVVTTGDPAMRSYNGIRTRRMRGSRYRFNLAVRAIASEAAHADIIQTFTYHGCLPSLFAGRLTRKPVFMVCLGLFGDAWRTMRGRFAGEIWRMWERFLMTRSYERVFFLSEFSLQAGLRMGVCKQRAFVNSPGINAAEFVPCPEKNGVLFVGKWNARKGVDIVLEVARVLPDIPFQLVGWADDGGYRKAAPPNVSFIEMPDARELNRMFDRAAVFFLPSRAETFGVAVLQAMAAGCAVVSTIPLPYEGYCSTVDDHAGMTRAIEQLCRDHELRARLGMRNREAAKRFTWQSFCESLYSHYLQAMNRERRTTASCR
jgi:glycosyltransferase involved in cell wall biosynthesis